MKRFHVNVRVRDLEESVNFYSALFGVKPTVQKEDYAKWMLDDPRINFAISLQPSRFGLEHLGIQAETEEELAEVYENLEKAQGNVFHEGKTACCYANSEKSWIIDPSGIEWEAFYTFGESTFYGNPNRKPNNNEANGSQNEEGVRACCSGIPAV